jgi:acetylornithine deacetylase/succinyl-diaminopimelate desuccinylase-like protein
MNREAIHRHIDAHLDEHVAHVQRWVRQPSVSWDGGPGVRDCAALVAESFRALGCREVEILEGRFHPGVWAVYDAGAPVTIHSYCMFDTRPASPTGWSHDPWSAALVARPPYPRVLVGRGALNAKGPYVAFLNALASIVAVEGRLPVNVLFLAEGEEIMGSPTYRAFVDRYRDRLRTARISHCVTGAQSARGTVSVGLGLKGMVVVELTASGKAWGHGPAATIHSSAAPLVDSPPFRLAQALATLTEPDGRGCRVDGLAEAWSYRKPLPPAERQLLEALAARQAGRDWRDVLPVGGAANAPAVRGGLDGLAPLVNFLYGPSLNVAGLRGGFLGAGTGTVPFIVPHAATAMLDLRMVVELSPDEIVARIRGHLDARGFGDIELTVLSAFGHAQTPPDHPAVRAVQDTLAAWRADTEVWPIQAAGGPWTAVPSACGVPMVRGGAIGGGGGGAVDEYLVIEGDGRVAGLADAEKFHVDLLDRLARALAPSSG